MNKMMNALSALNIYFSGIIGSYRVYRKEGNCDPALGLKAQQDFIGAMNKTLQEIINGERHEILGVGEEEIRSMRYLAGSFDWTQGYAIRKMYDAYSEIRGKEPYPEFFFEGID